MERKPIRSDPKTVKRLLEWLDKQDPPRQRGDGVEYRKKRHRHPVDNVTRPHQGGLPGLGKRN